LENTRAGIKRKEKLRPWRTLGGCVKKGCSKERPIWKKRLVTGHREGLVSVGNRTKVLFLRVRKRPVPLGGVKKRPHRGVEIKKIISPFFSHSSLKKTGRGPWG